PPNLIDEGSNTLSTAVAIDGSVHRLRIENTARLRSNERLPASMTIYTRRRVSSATTRAKIIEAARTIFSLDDNLAPFYARVESDPELRWACAGAGRLLRSPTAFEDVVRTICTTNCAWSATKRMIGALVTHLGDEGVTFPHAQAMAAADESFYRDVARAGYRGAYLRTLAQSVLGGEIDLEGWRGASAAELPEDELERRLLRLPGVGPYAAAHVMMLFGRHSRLVLDSWTRPTYARLLCRRHVADRTIQRRFARYGSFAGLAFWLTLWRARLIGEEEERPAVT
ncbi:MAG TPA: hypothetical protein VGD50_07470, partial [Candidatus Baltobacteraceae bacterium]